MKVLMVLVLAVFIAGCNAHIVRPNQPSHQVDMMKEAFWDYVAKATMTADSSLQQIRQSELGKEVNSLISQSTEAISKFSETWRTQVAPLTQDLMDRFTQESEQLKTRLQNDLTTLSSSSMDPEALKTILMQKSQELKTQMDLKMSELQAQMVPYTEEMKQKMDQSLEEFQRSMIPLAMNFETQFNQKSQEIQQSLAPYGEELRAKLDSDAQNLKQQLDTLWKSFSKMIQ
uniref:Apolipoprotein A-IV n=1 Tax=Sphaeramia orbicularis TaxID=375764 RepID=A0A673AMT2_9TELE